MEAVKADRIRDKFVAIPFDPEPFSKTWELLAGVEKNMGSVRIELPGTKIEASDSLDGKNEVQVFVENDSFYPDHDLEVDQIQLGEFAGAETNPGQALQASGELRSYLLQLWPSEGGDGEEVEASLTFDHPVVGVIYSSDRLAESDHSVGTAITHVGEGVQQRTRARFWQRPDLAERRPAYDQSQAERRRFGSRSDPCIGSSQLGAAIL